MGDPDADRAPPSPQPALTIVSPDGEDRGVVRLEAQPITVGREADNDIVLAPDDQQVVSREHCVIERVGRRWWARDLDSRNRTYIERGGERAQIDRAELLHGDAICLQADRVDDAGAGAEVRHWRLAFSDPGETQLASPVKWLQYFPGSQTVWVMGGAQLPRRVEAPPKARKMLLLLLARHRDHGEPRDGVLAGQAELKAALWPGDRDAQLRSDAAVANVAWELRAALGDDDGRLLQTVSGAGYRLVARL